MSGLGLEFIHYGQFKVPGDISHVLCTNDNGNGTSSNYSATENLRPDQIRREFSKDLYGLTYQIHFGINDLEKSNVRFEDYFEKATEAKNNHDQVNCSRLARTERVFIKNSIGPLQQLLDRISVLATRAQNEFTTSRFIDYCKDDGEHSLLLRISTVIATSNRWDI